MNYTTYDPRTGLIASVVSDRSLIGDQSAIEGVWNANVYYIKGRQPKMFPKPPGNPKNYDWDLASETWVFNANKATLTLRRIRNEMLTAVDRVNPIWYASLSAARQTELQEYRQALLDVTDQPTFPASVTWPTKPAWL